MAKHFTLFLYTLFLPLATWAAPECLFVLFDPGETYALRPVIQKCQQEGKVFQVLALGTARGIDLAIDDRFLIKGWKEVDRTWDRYAPLDTLNLEIKPAVVMIGVSSKIQHQIALIYRGQAKVIAYYDNFNPIDELPYASLIREIEQDVDLLLVPTQEAARSATAKQVQVAGKPDLLSFMRELNPLPYSPPDNTMVYIGGYDEDYEAAFRLFVRSCPDYEVTVCPHPKADGSLERRVLAEEQRQEFKLVEGASTAVIARSAVVVCHRSTLGVKAAFAGKRVIFFDLPGSKANQLIIDRWGLAKRVSNQEEFIAALRAEHSNVGAFEKAQMPINATQQIYDCLVP